MAGLAGLAFELFARMVDEGIKRKEESEIEACRSTLRRYKESYSKLREEYLEYKEHSNQIIAHLESSKLEMKEQAIKLTKNNQDLIARLTAAYIREETGGVVSLEEYDKAMAESQEGE